MTSLFRANASIGKFIVLEKQVGCYERGVLEERIYILPNAQRESLGRLALPVAAPRRAAPRRASPHRAVPRGSVSEPARERRRGGGRQLGSGPTNLFCAPSLCMFVPPGPHERTASPRARMG